LFVVFFGIFTFALRGDVILPVLLLLFGIVADGDKCVTGDGNVNFVGCE
jgi:hypothetical protein